MPDGAHVLLTGLSGFLAKHVALALLAGGFHVRGTVRSLAKAPRIRETLERHGGDVDRLDVVEADLQSDAGWDAAMAGCRFVQHVASPLPLSPPRERMALVPAARGGTLRVIEAAKRVGVERVVLTSSTAAVQYGHSGRKDMRFSEADVSNAGSPSIGAYALSKTLAERAAWDAVAGSALELTTINPAVILGPLLDGELGASASLVALMMKGRLPLVPDIAVGIVDARDVAAAHVAAMRHPEAAGRRFLLSAGTLSMMELGIAVAAACPAYRRKVPKFVLPDIVVRLGALVSRPLAELVPELGTRKSFVVEPAEAILGLSLRTPGHAVSAMAESLVRHRLV